MVRVISTSNLYLSVPKPGLQKFLIDKGASNLNFYLYIIWCIDAWGTPGKRKTKISTTVVENFLDECENRMVNRHDEGVEERGNWVLMQTSRRR